MYNKGVGKSTWINSFANYLCFDNLQKAVNSEKVSFFLSIITFSQNSFQKVTFLQVIAPVSSKFSITTDTGERQDIHVGRPNDGSDNIKGEEAINF